MNKAAPPNRAAAPTAPVRIAGASWELVRVVETPPGFADVATGAVDVGAGTPLVNGTPLPGPALGKAGGLLALGLGVAVEFDGFNTLRPISSTIYLHGGNMGTYLSMT